MASEAAALCDEAAAKVALPARAGDKPALATIAKATAYFQAQGYNVVTIDGARIEFPDGWGLLRASNTSPKLVMRVEAQTDARVAEIRAMIEAKVKELNG